MAEVVLFHHLQGLTPGLIEFAGTLRSAGHTVHIPDLFEGRTFDSLEAGSAYTEGIGAAEFRQRVDRVVDELPVDVVYAGISWGVMPAQRLAQTRPGARGAVLLDAFVPITGEWAFGPWPEAVPVQVHGKDADPFFAGEGDLDAARALVATVGPTAELFVYPGDQHLFIDSSLASYDAAAAEALTRRVLDFLTRAGTAIA